MKKRLVAALCACLLPAAGCTPRTALTPPPAAPPAVTQSNGPTVKADWSRLTPYEPEQGVFTRRYEAFTDTLIPAGDYGPLIPFLGDRLGGLSGNGDRYGLATLEGEIVADPVFSNVWRGDSSGGYHNGPPLPYMMLGKGVSTTSPDEWPEGGGWAMAALDGSWCTEWKYTMDSELTIWGRDINQNATEDGLFVLDGDALVYLDAATGRERLRVEGIPADNLYDALFSVRWDGDGAVYAYHVYTEKGTDDYRQTFRADASGIHRLTGWEAERAELRYTDEKAIRTRKAGGAEVVDESGNVLLRTEHSLDYRTDADGGAYIEFQSGNDETGAWYMEILALYSADTLERVADSPLTGRRVRNMVVGDLWYWCREGENVLFFRGNEVYPISWPEDPADFMWGRTVMFHGERGYSIVTLDGAVLARDMEYENVAHLFDRVTGAPYLSVREGRRLLFYSEDGKLLHTFAAAPNERGAAAGGALLVSGEDGSGLRNEAGEWLFHYPLPAGEWD